MRGVLSWELTFYFLFQCTVETPDHCQGHHSDQSASQLKSVGNKTPRHCEVSLDTSAN